MPDPKPDPTPSGSVTHHLLAALQRLVDAIDPLDEPESLEEYFKDPIRQARAAIAKATKWATE